MQRLADGGATIDEAYIEKVCGEASVDADMVRSILGVQTEDTNGAADHDDTPDPSDLEDLTNGAAEGDPEEVEESSRTLTEVCGDLLMVLFRNGAVPGADPVMLANLAEELIEDEGRVLLALKTGADAMDNLWVFGGKPLSAALAFTPADEDAAAEVADMLRGLEVEEETPDPAPAPKGPTPRPSPAPAPKASGKPAAPAPDASDPERVALIAELDTLDKTVPKDRRDAIKAEMGIERPRKAGTPRLRAYVERLRATSAPAPKKDAAPASKGGMSDEEMVAWMADRLTRFPHSPLNATVASGPLKTTPARIREVVLASDTLDFEDSGLIRKVDPDSLPGAAAPAPAPKAPKASRAAPSVAEAKHDGAYFRKVRPMVLIGAYLSHGQHAAETMEGWVRDLVAEIEANAPAEKGPMVGWPYNDGPKALASALKVALMTGRKTLPDFLCIPAGHPYGEYLASVVVDVFGSEVTVIRAG